MNQLHINFAPRTLRRTLYHTTTLAWLLISVGMVLCISVGLTARTLLSRYTAQEMTLSRLTANLHQRSATKPPVKQQTVSEAQSGAINQAIAQLNLPWRDMLDAVETATPSTIALLALEPDAKRGILKGTAEAKTSGDMITYIESLKRQNFFAAVVLTKHEINEQDPDRPLRFQFEAAWMEDAK